MHKIVGDLIFPVLVQVFYMHWKQVQDLLNLVIIKRYMVIGVDTMSSIIDYTDRNTCVLFGDGAGGVLLEPTE